MDRERSNFVSTCLFELHAGCVPSTLVNERFKPTRLGSGFHISGESAPERQQNRESYICRPRKPHGREEQIYTRLLEKDALARERNGGIHRKHEKTDEWLL